MISTCVVGKPRRATDPHFINVACWAPTISRADGDVTYNIHQESLQNKLNDLLGRPQNATAILQNRYGGVSCRQETKN
jgi:hypothetical protein